MEFIWYFPREDQEEQVIRYALKHSWPVGAKYKSTPYVHLKCTPIDAQSNFFSSSFPHILDIVVLIEGRFGGCQMWTDLKDSASHFASVGSWAGFAKIQHLFYCKDPFYLSSRSKVAVGKIIRYIIMTQSAYLKWISGLSLISEAMNFWCWHKL